MLIHLYTELLCVYLFIQVALRSIIDNEAELFHLTSSTKPVVYK